MGTAPNLKPRSGGGSSARAAAARIPSSTATTEARMAAVAVQLSYRERTDVMQSAGGVQAFARRAGAFTGVAPPLAGVPRISGTARPVLAAAGTHLPNDNYP